MQVTDFLPTTDSFRVEVSGWDQDEIYFVEKSNLDWDDFAGKHISLKHMLPEGAMIFVRMLQPTAMRQAPPVPYHVEFIGCDAEGMHQFRLNAVQPRYGHEPPSVN
jgi:hypothetical protein